MSKSIISKIIKTDNYREYFENPRREYFNPKYNTQRLIKSKKRGMFIRPVPDYYGPRDSKGFALIRGYNCQARCHFCYLQSYYKSDDIVKFHNIDEYVDFLESFIEQFRDKFPNKPLYLYDGDSQDSLGYANLKLNVYQINSILELIEGFENVFLEVRSKCFLSKDQFHTYNSLKISDRLIFAISFSPSKIIDEYEPGTADLDTRFEFSKYIVSKGGSIGVRIDPIIYYKDLDTTISMYSNLLSRILDQIEQINDIALGFLRIKKDLYKKLQSINSNLTKKLEYKDKFYKYPKPIRENLYNILTKNINHNKVYMCMDS